jgi:hypothetical protein
VKTSGTFSFFRSHFFFFSGNLITLRAEGSFNKNSTSPKAQAEEDLPSPLDDGKQPLFEQMFSLLLHEPRYLAELSHRCPKIDCSDFVRTIVVDIFGGVRT